MKKFITLLVLFLAAFCHSSFAQPGTICNPDFNFTVSGNVVQFTPATINASAMLQHRWYFGDNSLGGIANPLHTYSAPGVYNVMHVVTYYRSPNDSNIVSCSDSVVHQVVIGANGPCVVRSSFSFGGDNFQPNKFYFTNQSIGMTANTTVRWSFGDGTYSDDNNPTHIYTSSGDFTVCLTVKRDSLCADDTCLTVRVPVSTNSCDLVPGFEAIPYSQNPLAINFYYQTQPFDPTDSVSYTFGDGMSATGFSLMHTYAIAGTYNVCIRVKKVTIPGIAPCVREFCRTIIVQPAAACDLRSAFNFSRDSVQPNKVYFTNVSSGTTPNTIVRWNFGDGTSSDNNNPSHIYNNSGAFTVCLSVRRDSLCADDTCRIIQVQLPTNTCNLVAGFDSRPDSLHPMLIHFTNHSLPFDPTDSIRYTFGDGTSSTDINPSHAYTVAGTYNVCIRVKKITASGSVVCVREYCRTIIVQSATGCNLHAGFSFARDSVQSNKIHFTNLSTGITPNTVVRWSFGDGTSSDNNNPTHIYTTSGAFTVCLSVKRDSLCADDTCRIVQVQVPTNTCNLVAGFDSRPDSLHPMLIHFTNHSLPFDPTDSIRYTFGDGTSSTDINPSHAYTVAGTYNVCIRVKKITASGTAPCVREFCRVITVQPAPCDLQVHFSSHPDSLNRNTIHFTNLSTPYVAADSIRWTFGDGTSSSDVNPTHTYTAPGNYPVCLVVKRMGLSNTVPCVREYCSTITVQPACNLNANFTFHPDSSNARLIHFSNLSTPLNSTDSIRWTFGDGTSSNDINPTHGYTTAGSFTVCLRVKKMIPGSTTPCVREYCKTVIIQQDPVQCPLVASFTFHKDTILNPMRYSYWFVNTSTPAGDFDSSFWDFGDGSPIYINTNNLATVTYVYQEPGVYSVCLRIKKARTSATSPACERQVCQTIVVQPSCTIVTPDFYYDIDTVNLITPRYHFQNNTQPYNTVDSVYWDFGDGTFSHDISPDHVFPGPGAYIVCLTVRRHITGATFICERQVCKTIIVPLLQPTACNLSVNFDTRADSNNNRKLFFTNLSTPHTSNALVQWTFGDGSGGTGWNADHMYVLPGQYQVCLRVSINNTCIKDTCKMITILPSLQDSCNIPVGFISRIDSANRRKVYFTNTTAATVSAMHATWNFGDGTFGTGWNADHIYAQPGRYYVCLTIVRGNTCTRVRCDSVFVPGNNTVPPVNCDTTDASYVYRRDGYMPNKLFFFATSNVPVLQQYWIFTKMPNGPSVTVNQRDPVHVFEDTGSYRVCLKAILQGGCVKEHCDVVSIATTATATQCMLQTYPNPAQSQLSVNLQLREPHLITASVYNLQNVLLMQQTQQGFTGNNLVTIHVQDLVPGYYTIRLVYGNQVCYARFQKL